jgi:hypothetical protein
MLALLVVSAASQTGTLFYYAFEERIELSISEEKVLARFTEQTNIDSLISSKFGDQIEYKLEIVDNRTTIIEGEPNEIVELADYLATLPRLHTINPILLTTDGCEMGVTDEICVQFLEGVSESQKQQLYRDLHVNVKPSRSPFRTLLTVPKGGDALAVANRIQETGLVQYSHPNFIVKAEYSQPPNDEYFDMQFPLHNTGQVITDGHTGTPDADVDALEAWEVTTGNFGVIVSVTDEGVPLDNPDLPVARLVVIEWRLNRTTMRAYRGLPPDVASCRSSFRMELLQ